MEKNNKQDLEVRWVSLRLAERFRNVLYPIHIPTLLHLLPNIGYIVPRKILKGIIEAGEPLAVKGNNELLFSQNNNILGIEGKELSQVIDGFNELRGFWLEQLNPSPSAETHYIELYGEGIIASVENPTGLFADFWSRFEMMPKLSKVVDMDIVNFGLHLVPQKMDPNSTEWFDLRIEPQIISSANHYSVYVIWRSKNMETALKNFKNVIDIIRNVIREVER